MNSTNYWKILSNSFETRARSSGVQYVAIKEDAPAWIQDAVRAAHNEGDIPPDDIRFEMIMDIAVVASEAWSDSVSTQAFVDDMESNYIDSLVPIYTNELTMWLASSNLRLSYVDDAADTFGISPEINLFDRLQLGYMFELTEIFNSLNDFINEMNQIDSDKTVF